MAAALVTPAPASLGNDADIQALIALKDSHIEKLTSENSMLKS